MKKIILITGILGINLILAKTCIVTYIIKKAKPSYPYLFYKEEFACKNAKQGWEFQKGLGCRKRSFMTKDWKRQFLYICPIMVGEKK